MLSMRSINNFLFERSGSPDNINFSSQKKYGFDSDYARPFIYNVKSDKVIWGKFGETHNDILFGMRDSDKERFGMDDALFIDELDNIKGTFKTGRIWVIDSPDKTRKYDVYMSWWQELTDDELKKYNLRIINSYNKHNKTDIQSYLCTDNNGKFLKFNTKSTEIKKIDKNDNTRHDKEILQAIHIATQKEKEKFFKNFKVARDERNQKIYNHTKSKTEAEWRSIMYQESKNNKHNMKTLLEYILEQREVTFGDAKANYGQCIILAGGAASGKGYVQKNIQTQFKVFDVDDLKKMYLKLVKKGIIKDEHEYSLNNPEDVSELHEIVKKRQWKNKQRTAMWGQRHGEGGKRTIPQDERHSSKLLPNILFDMVCDDIDDIEVVVKKAIECGYTITLIYVCCPLAISRVSNAMRGIGDPTKARSVPDKILTNGHNGADKLMKEIFSGKHPKLSSLIDRMWVIWSSAAGFTIEGEKDKHNRLIEGVVKVKGSLDGEMDSSVVGKIDSFLNKKQAINYDELRKLRDASKDLDDISEIEKDEKYIVNAKYQKQRYEKFVEMVPEFDPKKMDETTESISTIDYIGDIVAEEFEAIYNEYMNED